MADDLPPLPVRSRWWRVLGWGLAVALVALCGWSGWLEYDYRAAVREARAAGFLYDESPTPFAAIRKDWHAAFHLATWSEHERELLLSHGTNLAPLRPLLVHLDPTSLVAENCRNVAALRGLTRLRHLDLADSDVRDLAPLAGLTRLQRLDLRGCSGVKDLAPLARITQLRWLGLHGCTGVTDLAPLVDLTQLQVLNLCDCKGVKDLAPLSGLAQLRDLYLARSTSFTDLAPLAGLGQLQTLSLSGCTGVADLAPLARLTQLQTLNRDGCTGLSVEEVAAFKTSHPQVDVSGP